MHSYRPHYLSLSLFLSPFLSLSHKHTHMSAGTHTNHCGVILKLSNVLVHTCDLFQYQDPLWTYLTKSRTIECFPIARTVHYITFNWPSGDGTVLYTKQLFLDSKQADNRPIKKRVGKLEADVVTARRPRGVCLQPPLLHSCAIHLRK